MANPLEGSQKEKRQSALKLALIEFAAVFVSEVGWNMVRKTGLSTIDAFGIAPSYSNTLVFLPQQVNECKRLIVSGDLCSCTGVLCPPILQPATTGRQTALLVYAMMIGSRTRFSLRLGGLIALLMLIIFALYAALARVTDDALFVLVMILVFTPLRRSLNSRARAMWAMFLTKDAAYGRVTESGIDYNEFFHSHSADWSQIRCVEHFPDSGRIKIYLFGKSRPVQFGRSTTEGRGAFTVHELLKNQVQCSGGDFIECQPERTFAP